MDFAQYFSVVDGELELKGPRSLPRRFDLSAGKTVPTFWAAILFTQHGEQMQSFFQIFCISAMRSGGRK